MKTCTKCGESKEANDTNFPVKNGKLQSQCRVCVTARAVAWAKANPERAAANKRAWADAHPESGKEAYQRNRDARLAYAAAWREANPDYNKEYGAAYYVEHSEEIRANAATWSKEHPEQRRATARAWRQANLETVRDSRRRSKAGRKALVDATHEPYLRRDIFERDRWMCGLCLDPVDASLEWPDMGSKSIDHVIPLSLGGGDSPANVQLAHLGCNISKGARIDV